MNGFFPIMVSPAKRGIEPYLHRETRPLFLM
jgi:hypothetical protein